MTPRAWVAVHLAQAANDRLTDLLVFSGLVIGMVLAAFIICWALWLDYTH